MKLEYTVITNSNIHRMNRPQAMQYISEAAIQEYRGGDSYCAITTVVEWWLPRIPKSHMAIVVCGDGEKMLAASHYLKTSNIGYCPIKMAVERKMIENNLPMFNTGSLIVTDIIGSINRVTNLMLRIPGNEYKPIDDNITFGRKRRSYKRIFIKACWQASREYTIPEFPTDLHTLTNKKSIDWLNAFREHWESNEIQQAVLATKLTKAIKDKTIVTMVSDPKFTI